MGFVQNTVDYSRKFRSKYLGALIEPLIKLGTTANHLSFISLLAVFLAAWFLFENNLYFILFSILHIIFDAFDGVLARATAHTSFGKAFDTIVDGVYVLLVALKITIVFHTSVGWLIAGLFILHNIIYFISRMNTTIYTPRTILFVMSAFGFYAVGLYTVAIIALVGLFFQAKDYHLTGFKPSKNPR